MKRKDTIRLLSVPTDNMPYWQIRKLLKEKGLLIQEVEMDSSIVDTHRYVSPEPEIIEMHSHPYYEIVYCENGRPDFLMDRKRYSVRPGDILLIPPGVIHRPLYNHPDACPHARILLWVNADFIRRIIQGQYQSAGASAAPSVFNPFLLHTAGTRWEYLADFFTGGLNESTRKAPGWEQCLQSITALLVVHLMRAVYEPEALRALQTQTGLLEQILDYIQQNLSTPLTVKQTAQHFHISESTLTHLFRRELGFGYYTSVTQQRMTEAKNRIRQDPSATMEQIGREVGYTEYSAFYRAFRSKYGVTPLQYRKLAVHE